MKIGIYGGSFNPPHKGHENAAEAAIAALGLDKLLVIPAGDPPHKQLAENTPTDTHRYNMAKLAFTDIDKCEVSDYELKEEGPSYTINTIRHFKEVYPDDELYLLMGTDMFITLDAWFEGVNIMRECSVVAFARNDGEMETIKAKRDEFLSKYGEDSIILDLPVTSCASSDVRRLLPCRLGCDYISDAVYWYIIRNRLYGAKPDFAWLRSKSHPMHKPKRVPHVIGCEEEAVRLALRWGADVENARTAGILHDITKICGLDEQLQLCRNYGIMTDALESQSEKLLHSKTGAATACEIFGVNSEVFSAIYWHTTGKADMTLLEKVLYLADYVEPNRDFEGVDELRRLCYTDIDDAMRLGLEMSVDDLNERGVPIHKNTFEALQFYKHQSKN